MSESSASTERRYRVTLVTLASYTITVTAEDEDAAIELAFENAPSELQSLRGHGDPGYVDIGEGFTYDGFTTEGGSVEAVAE